MTWNRCMNVDAHLIYEAYKPKGFTGVKTNEHGTKKWYVNGELHRLDGPAVEQANGFKAWWVNGKPHREDGPAVEHASGGKEWWVNNKLIRKEGPMHTALKDLGIDL